RKAAIAAATGPVAAAPPVSTNSLTFAESGAGIGPRAASTMLPSVARVTAPDVSRSATLRAGWPVWKTSRQATVRLAVAKTSAAAAIASTCKLDELKPVIHRRHQGTA